MRVGVVTDSPVHLNPRGNVVVKEIVSDRHRRTVEVNAVISVAIASASEVAVVIKSIAIEPNSGPIPIDTMSIVVNPVPPNREIVAVVDLYSLITIPYLKSLDRNPANPSIHTRLHNKPMIFVLVDKVNDRERARGVEEFDRSRLSAAFLEDDQPFIVRPASDIGRIARDHFGHGIGHRPPRLGACARIAIVPCCGEIVRRRVGGNSLEEGTGQNAGTDCMLELNHPVSP